MARVNYSEEFKADAVALFLSTPSATYVSVARGVPPDPAISAHAELRAFWLLWRLSGSR
jgi:hypothetical protein